MPCFSSYSQLLYNYFTFEVLVNIYKYYECKAHPVRCLLAYFSTFYLKLGYKALFSEKVAKFSLK